MRSRRNEEPPGALLLARQPPPDGMVTSLCTSDTFRLVPVSPGPAGRGGRLPKSERDRRPGPASPSPGRTYIAASALVSAAVCAVFVVHELPIQLRPQASDVVFAPSGRLFLTGVIDAGVALVITGGILAEALLAFLARSVAGSQHPRQRAVLAALGGTAGGAVIAALLAIGTGGALQTRQTNVLLEVLCIAGGGVLGWAYEGVFQLRERRANAGMRDDD